MKYLRWGGVEGESGMGHIFAGEVSVANSSNISVPSIGRHPGVTFHDAHQRLKAMEKLSTTMSRPFMPPHHQVQKRRGGASQASMRVNCTGKAAEYLDP
jgi:hypothetical protein